MQSLHFAERQCDSCFLSILLFADSSDWESKRLEFGKHATHSK